MGGFAFIAIVTALKWLPFVRIAEKVFRALELPNPSNIDLKKSTKAQRKPDDPVGYGVYWFRY